MPPTSAALYLPISKNTLNPFLQDTTDLKHKLKALSLAEVSSLLLIARLPLLKKNQTTSPERFIASAIELGNEQCRKSGLQAFIAQTEPLIGLPDVRSGHTLLREYKIILLDDTSIKGREYLMADGSWDFDFRDRHEAKLQGQRVKLDSGTGRISHLTLEQSRLYREFEAQRDEQMHVQGYAGTGKSTFIVAILSLLEQTQARVLLLAHTTNQLNAVSARVSLASNVHKQTFIGLAQHILPKELTSFSNQNFDRVDKSRATMPDNQLIQYLGIKTSGGFSAYQIVEAVRGTVFSFCHSDSSEITEKHIPRRFKSTLDNTSRGVVCQHANDLWKAFHTRQSSQFKPQVRGYHLIKWAALNQCKIPNHYTHVLLDESHHLPNSVLQILNNSPQALLSLGDEYQSLKGRATQPPGFIRTRELTHSVRSSHHLDSIINPIISIHPGNTKSIFRGNSNNRINIEYYTTAKVPDSASVILVADMWGLFEWAQRIAAGNVDIQLLSDFDKLNMFVQDCMELYTTGTRARHPELFRFKSWPAVAGHHNNSPGFNRINRMLEKGFSYKDWQQTQNKFNQNPVNTNNQATHALGLIESALNREFDNVMLTPGIFRSLTPKNKAEFSSAIYIGVTRAKHKLIVPEALRNWIEEITANPQSQPVVTASA